ncbi:uncharacterized protein VTP21DRAFT_557 [Calcarisporiella thermophila]|uniref:uncharacterized protein n=1 Tax=Calcarisporiella thermophila TaxID=911321 RepID=UPI003742E27F
MPLLLRSRSSSVVTSAAPSPVVVDSPILPAPPITPTGSLFQSSRALLDQLHRVPDFERLFKSNGPAHEGGNATTDPLMQVWEIFRRGAPLLHLFNVWRPNHKIDVSARLTPNEKKNEKIYVYYFLTALKDLGWREEEMFGISDVFLNDTNGFVKVVKTVTLLLNQMEAEGLLLENTADNFEEPPTPTDSRAKVVNEFVETERKYVQDLESLQNYMKQLQENNIVSADTIHRLFANLNLLIDFQRRFLCAIEANAELPPSEQRFGEVFRQAEEGFETYIAFCINYESACELINTEITALEELADMIEPRRALPALLIRPVQRLALYTLLLENLIKHTHLDHPYYDEQSEALSVARRILERVNEEKRRQENLAYVKKLQENACKEIENARDGMGALLLTDVFSVCMAGSKADQMRTMRLCLFERGVILIKENETRKKGNAMDALGLAMRRRPSGAQLKGIVEFGDITSISTSGQQGSYSIKVSYNQGSKWFELCNILHEEKLKQWETLLLSRFEESRKEKDASVLQPFGNLQSKHYHDDQRSYVELDENDGENEVYTSESEDTFDDGMDYYWRQLEATSLSEEKSIPLFQSSSELRSNSQVGNWSESTLVDGDGANSSAGTNRQSYGRKIHPLQSSNGLPTMSMPPLTRLASAPAIARVPQQRSASSPVNGTALSEAEEHGPDKALPQQKDLSSIDEDAIHAVPYTPPPATTPSLVRSPSHSALQQSARDVHRDKSSIGQYDSKMSSLLAKTRLRSMSSPLAYQPPPLRRQESSTAMPPLPQYGLGVIVSKSSHPLETPPLSPPAIESQPVRVLHSLIESPPTPGSPTSSIAPSPVLSPNQIMVCIRYDQNTYKFRVSRDVSFSQLLEHVRHKLQLRGHLSETTDCAVKYQDEDGDWVSLTNDEDVITAIETLEPLKNEVEVERRDSMGMIGIGCLNLVVNALN